jgi:hypothetical protein
MLFYSSKRARGLPYDRARGVRTSILTTIDGSGLKVRGGARAILAVAALIGYYVSIDIPIGGSLIPNVTGTPFGLALLLLHYASWSRKDFEHFAYIFGFFCLSAIWAIAIHGGGVKPILACGQLAYSFLGAYGLYLELRLWRRVDLSRLAMALAVLIVVGALLEVYTPFQSVARSFASAHYFSIGVTDVARDLNVFGRYRPRLFTQEPSLLATKLSLFIMVFFITSKKSFAAIAFVMAISALGLFAIRSPFTLVAAAIVGPMMLLSAQEGRARGQQVVISALSILLCGAALYALGVASTAIFAQRLSYITSGQDWSTTVRTYGAIIAGWDVASRYPFFGVGVANFQEAREVVAATYMKFHVPDYVTHTVTLERSVNNGLATSLIYFGFFGTSAYLLLSMNLYGRLAGGAPWYLVVIVLFIVLMTAGNIYSPLVIWQILILVAALRVSRRNAVRIRPTRPRPI